MQTSNINGTNNHQFNSINNPPPLNKQVLLQLFDKWRGNGRETEFITATYNGNSYTTSDGKQIHQRFIIGWKNIDHKGK